MGRYNLSLLSTLPGHFGFSVLEGSAQGICGQSRPTFQYRACERVLIGG
jgi:hypothetical protein